MKKENSEILEQLGKDAGFKVPDGFFEDFNARLTSSLPDVKITEVDEKPSLWVRVRPLVYLAAMFAGVFCMMKVFTGITSQQMSVQQRVSKLAPGIVEEQHADEFINYGGVSDYDILIYEDSVKNDPSYNQQD